MSPRCLLLAIPEYRSESRGWERCAVTLIPPRVLLETNWELVLMNKCAVATREIDHAGGWLEREKGSVTAFGGTHQ